VATFTGTIDLLQHGLIWELLGTDTTIVPEVTYRDGVIILVDLPIQEFHHLGRIVQGIFKYMFQRAILRRNASRYPRPVFLWADEAQNFVSSFDYQYQAVARSARACTVYLSQNVSNYYSVLGARGRDEANSFLANLVTAVFTANSDHNTNDYASKLIAQHWQTLYNYSSSRTDKTTNSSAGGSQNLQFKVIPAEFTTLRKGGPQNGLQVDAIVFQGGRIWRATGDTWMRTVFKQG
jgi:type IV secretory pathway TraG/TraD family ATPase VirD4